MKKNSFLLKLVGFIVAIIFFIIGFVLSVYLDSKIPGVIVFLLGGAIAFVVALMAADKSTTNGMD